MTKINLVDESGDKKYFTIIPNYILNHSSSTAQALYTQLKRLAGESGIAYPGYRYLKEKLKISYPTIRKELNYLLENGWIKYAGKKIVDTDGGKQEIKTYKIIDLWEKNMDHYNRGERIDTPSSQNDQRGERIGTQGVKTRGERIETKEEQSKQEPSFNKKEKTFKDFDEIELYDGTIAIMRWGQWEDKRDGKKLDRNYYKELP